MRILPVASTVGKHGSFLALAHCLDSGAGVNAARKLVMTILENTTRFTRLAIMLLGFAPLGATAQGPATAEAADTQLAAALANGNVTALAGMLDDEIWWTDATGETFRKQALAARASAPLLGNLAAAEAAWHAYGPVAVAQTHAGRAHVVRIWVERPAGWRLLAYQEVRSLESPPTVTPGTGGDCENPCRTVGIDPENATQAAVIRAYQELEISAEERDIALWSARIADEFVAASSNSDRLFDKPSRIAGLQRNTMRGLSPTPLTNGRIYDFDRVAVMVSEHVPDRGRPLHVTRVWVERDGQWVETLSYQTARQGAAGVR